MVDEALTLKIFLDEDLIVAGPKTSQTESVPEVYPARFAVDLGAWFQSAE